MSTSTGTGAGANATTSNESGAAPQPADKPPVIVTAGVLVEGGKVLLTQRPPGTHLENLWEFPGGKVDPGESPQDALVRELREELGIEVTVGYVLECTYWRYPNKDVLLLFFVVNRTSRGHIENRGVAAHSWVGLDKLDRYEMPPADVPVLARVRGILAEYGTGRASYIP